jgi:hypothetical protein
MSDWKPSLNWIMIWLGIRSLFYIFKMLCSVLTAVICQVCILWCQHASWRFTGVLATLNPSMSYFKWEQMYCGDGYWLNVLHFPPRLCYPTWYMLMMMNHLLMLRCGNFFGLDCSTSSSLVTVTDKFYVLFRKTNPFQIGTRLIMNFLEQSFLVIMA